MLIENIKPGFLSVFTKKYYIAYKSYNDSYNVIDDDGDLSVLYSKEIIEISNPITKVLYE